MARKSLGAAATLASHIPTKADLKQVASFNVSGTLTVGTGVARFYLPFACTILNVIVSVGTAPTGAAVIVDVNKNGITIFTTQANRPTIAVSTNADTSSVPDVTAMAVNDYFTVDIDQIGSTVAGANLVVQIVYSI